MNGAPHVTALLPVFAFDNDRIASVLALCTAIGLHATLALGFVPSPSAPAQPIISEIELAPPPPLPPPPPPPEEPPKEKPPTVPAPIARAAAPPAAARAGALVTASPTANVDDVADFVSDPTGTSYGSGVVARGGTAEKSAGGRPYVPEAPPAPAESDGIAPAGSLSRAARLQGDDPCRGFYPREARADVGSAIVRAVVLPSGRVTRAAVASESPSGQGFGAAAQRCLASANFASAVDKSGHTVAAAVTVTVRFAR